MKKSEALKLAKKKAREGYWIAPKILWSIYGEEDDIPQGVLDIYIHKLEYQEPIYYMGQKTYNYFKELMKQYYENNK